MKFIILGVLVLLFIPSVQGLTTPIPPTFIPQIISPNSSFLMISYYADSGSIRLGWDVKYNPLCQFGYIGSLQKIDDRYVCYFSDIDPEATCGPSPFTGCAGGIEYTMEITAVNEFGETTNNTFKIQLADIELTSTLTLLNSTIFMEVCPQGGANLASYEIYTANFTSTKNGFLDKNLGTGCFLGNTSLDPGVYYFAFEASAVAGNGGDLKKIVIEAEDIVQDPGSSVNNDITSDFDYITPLLGEGQTTFTYTKGTITNIGSTTYSNLAVRIPTEFTNILNIILLSGNLTPNETISFNTNLRNIQKGMHIFTAFDLLSDNKVIAKIPIRISVSTTGSGGTVIITESSDTIGISPDPIISGIFNLADGIQKTFTLENNGNDTMTNFSKTESRGISGITTVTFPSSILAGGTGSITVTLSPNFAGKYSGKITIDTSVGSKDIFVVVEAFVSLSPQIQTANNNFNDLKANLTADQLIALEPILLDIEDKLKDAENDNSFSLYKSAEISLAEANVLMESLDTFKTVKTDPGPGDGFDIFGLLIPIIIVVVVLIVLVFVYMFIKNRRLGGDEFTQEGYEDEGYSDENFDEPSGSEG